MELHSFHPISMWMKAVQNYRKHKLAFACIGCSCIAIPVLIHRGIHGKYGIGIHGLSILFLGLLPFIALSIALRHLKTKRLWFSSLIVATLLATCLVIYYLSRNGLWCAQHPNVRREMCSKLVQFASFAVSSNVTLWWLTMGDLLAIQRGLQMPIPWEHDIDVCITPEQFPMFEKSLKSNVGLFHPEAEILGPGHWYLPIDMAKLGLSSRDAEGVNIDIWTCPRLPGNITRVLYCNGLMNVPGSLDDRNAILKKYYGDYSVFKYAHHNTMCRIWNSW